MEKRLCFGALIVRLDLVLRAVSRHSTQRKIFEALFMTVLKSIVFVEYSIAYVIKIYLLLNKIVLF
jgi:hypothetical protein